MINWKSSSVAIKNLDVSETSQEENSHARRHVKSDGSPEPHLSVVYSRAEQGNTGQGKPRQRYCPHGSKCFSLHQASNLIEGVRHAKTIDLRLVAHATIHWSGTVAFDDPYGNRFARVREGFHKYLLRRQIPGGLTAVWCRECKAHTDIVHCHLLFHLPIEYRTGAKLLQIEAALFRLVGRHGDGILGEFAVKLKIWLDPDGFYLLKGGDREVWEKFKIRKEWRQSQGIIYGKRCGTTQNIGSAARRKAAKREVA
jgi:hypothetical protein